CQQNRNWPYSF
nr:immunoglobulin light chain junction region [Macaca mulatta]